LALRLSLELYTRALQDFLTLLDAQRALYAAKDQLVQSEEAVAANLIGDDAGRSWGLVPLAQEH
jgi:outer membrane protein TolC